MRVIKAGIYVHGLSILAGSKAANKAYMDLPHKR